MVDGSSSPGNTGGGGSRDNNICVGYRHQFDLIDERLGEVEHLYSVEGNKVNLVAAVDVYEDEEPELLLCYNREFSLMLSC